MLLNLVALLSFAYKRIEAIDPRDRTDQPTVACELIPGGSIIEKRFQPKQLESGERDARQAIQRGTLRVERAKCLRRLFKVSRSAELCQGINHAFFSCIAAKQFLDVRGRKKRIRQFLKKFNS